VATGCHLDVGATRRGQGWQWRAAFVHAAIGCCRSAAISAAGARFVVAIDRSRTPVSSYDVVMMIEIVPGISVDSERAFGKPVMREPT
jgi:hypothetical protein